jgi:hypothetical protein
MRIAANFDFGPAVGGGVNFGGAADMEELTSNWSGLGKFGAGFGSAVDFGVLRTVTYTTPRLWWSVMSKFSQITPDKARGLLRLSVCGFFIAAIGGGLDFFGFAIEQRIVSVVGFVIAALGVLIGLLGIIWGWLGVVRWRAKR